MAAMLGERRGRLSLSAPALRSLLDGIASRLDESRDLSRYVIGLLIFLGLLGTFWGLSQTIGSIGDVIRGLTVGVGDLASGFENLKRGLASPLSGMGTAFSSSLFGLGGSLVLGFLDLQAAQAQNRFFNDLEDGWPDPPDYPQAHMLERASSRSRFMSRRCSSRQRKVWSRCKGPCRAAKRGGSPPTRTCWR